MWTNDNYFFYGYLTGAFDHDCCPRYLRPQHFAALRRYASEGRVTIFHGRWLYVQL